MFAKLFSKPKIPALKRPALSMGSIFGLFDAILICLFILVLGAAEYIANLKAPVSAFAVAAVLGLLLGMIAIAFLWLLVSLLLKRIARFIFNPYGFKDVKRSEQALRNYLFGTSVATLFVRDGAYAPESDMSLLQITGKGPGHVDVDWESGILIEKDGKISIFHYGNHDLGEKDQLLGAVDLRTQKEPFDLTTVSTKDGMTVRVRGEVSYQIQQDATHLKTQRAHKSSLEALKCAIVPRDEWKNKTKGAIGQMVNETIRQYTLSEMFLSQPSFATLDMRSTFDGLVTQKPATPALVDIQKRAQRYLNGVAYLWGVEVTGVKIDAIVPPEELAARAIRAYQVWIEREGELQKIETKARVAQREAESDRDLAAIHRDREMIRLEADAAVARSAASVEKDTTVLRAEMEAKVKRILADAEQTAVQIKAQAEAEAYRLRMAAIGEAGLDVVRRIDLLENVTGRQWDDAFLQEFLRAIGLIKADAFGANGAAQVVQIGTVGEGEIGI